MSSGTVIIKELATKLLDSVGNVVWEGAGLVCDPQYYLPSGAVSVGDMVGIPTAGATIQSPGAAKTTTPTRQNVYCAATAAAAAVNLLGVAITPSPVSPNNLPGVLVAGRGSVINCKSLTAALLNSNSIGAWVIPTTTAGAADATTTRPTGVLSTMGRVVSIASATVGAGTSGSLTELTILVQPG